MQRRRVRDVSCSLSSRIASRQRLRGLLGHQRLDELIKEDGYSMNQLNFRGLWIRSIGDHDATTIDQDRAICGQKAVEHSLQYVSVGRESVR
jgi:hypothetical protein